MASQFHLADLFEGVAAAVPDRLAVIADTARLTYAELNERCDRLASGLAAHGVGRGDSVGLYLYNGPAYLEGFIAACFSSLMISLILFLSIAILIGSISSSSS